MVVKIVNEGSSLTKIDEGSSLTIVNKGLSLSANFFKTVVFNTIVFKNYRFENECFLKRWCSYNMFGKGQKNIFF